jgi:hypothetical protein
MTSVQAGSVTASLTTSPLGTTLADAQDEQKVIEDNVPINLLFRPLRKVAEGGSEVSGDKPR